ncbi:MAG: hypothetical protein ACOCWQ_06275, partial [Nanoarchaeota archaeon]
YGMPGFAEINDEFEIEHIEQTSYLIREIRRRILQHIDGCIKFLESILHPEGSLSSMMETSSIEEEHKDMIMGMLRKLNHALRHGQRISMLHDKQQDADFICTMTKDWPKMRMQFAEISELLEKAWKEDHYSKQENGYFG